ncbi:hypothetical protein G6L37_34805 [Agrobacterium rubi]|nr:hypothetical protein [Agrobacterium rubi]NTF23739.1 hypothetical protein [Agrobacterium rubi]
MIRDIKKELKLEPVYILGFLTIIGALGIVAGTLVASRGSSLGHLLVGASAFWCVIFGMSCGLVYIGEDQDRNFNAKRELIIPLLSMKMDKVCDRLGVVAVSEARLNCFERDGYRVWRDGGRLYVASVTGQTAVTDLIVDEDRILARKLSSIVYHSNDLDLRRLPLLARSEE